MGPWALALGHFNRRSSVGSVSWVLSSVNKKHLFLEQLTSPEPPAASLRLQQAPVAVPRAPPAPQGLPQSVS